MLPEHRCLGRLAESCGCSGLSACHDAGVARSSFEPDRRACDRFQRFASCRPDASNPVRVSVRTVLGSQLLFVEQALLGDKRQAFFSHIIAVGTNVYLQQGRSANKSVYDLFSRYTGEDTVDGDKILELNLPNQKTLQGALDQQLSTFTLEDAIGWNCSADAKHHLILRIHASNYLELCKSNDEPYPWNSFRKSFQTSQCQ